MNGEIRKRLVIVLGMHRSGTSAITRGLKVLRVELGDRLVPAIEGNNEKGFWEDADLNAFNDELLHYLGCNWHTPCPISSLEFERTDLTPFRQRAIELIHSKIEGVQLSGFKDPRLVPLMPFWRTVFARLDVDVSYVLSVRHPMSVARSLKNRDGFEPEKSYYLWLGHVVTSVLASEGSPRVVVSYDCLMDNPENQLRRIAMALNLPFNPGDSAFLEYTQNFLKEGLRHTQFGVKDFALDSTAPKATVLAYSLLEKVARDELAVDSSQVHEHFVQWAQHLKEISPSLCYMTKLEMKLSAVTSTVAERDSQIVALNKTVVNGGNELVELKQTLDEKAHALNQLAAHRDALLHEAAERQASLQEVSQELDKLRRFTQGENFELAKKEETITRVSERNETLRQQLAECETDLLRIYQSHGWKALTFYYGVRDALFPNESYRRLWAKKLFHFIFGFGSVFSRLKFVLWQLTRSLYHSLPISFERKQRLKSFGFNRFGFLLKNTGTYKMWRRSQARWSSQVAAGEKPQAAQPLHPEGLAFAIAPLTPLVSIIIPVYNQVEFTLRCLKSIQDHPNQASTEIIVVDDASQDETASILSMIPGVRHIRNHANLGFLRTCNRAATEARGEYLVFLNNDTEVQKDWLDSLLAVFDHFDHVGLVGAKLVYPNGRLQEAGGLIWQDASGSNFGRDDDPLKPEYNYVREVDYCSAACIAIKTSLFHSVRGFDEIFAPAYYEDTDLAFKVRQSGYKVLYQPACHVVHLEGGTCGTDLNSGVKSYQQINATTFAAKWAQILPEHYPPQNHDPVLARDRRIIGRCLIIDYWPAPDRDSASIDLINIIRLFQSLSYKVNFFPYRTTRHYGKYTEELQQMGVECLYEPYITTLSDYLKSNGRYFDLVILCRAPCAISYFETVRQLCTNAKIIFDTVDLHFLREERAAVITNSQRSLEKARALRRQELEIINKADCTWVVSQAEATLLKEQTLLALVEWIPFVRDIPGRIKGFDARRNIAFIGGYAHKPNVDAVSYFVEEIWPQVAKRLPGAQFLIAGSNMPESFHLLANERIRAVGYIEDLTQFFENCRLTVAPLRYGAGIKGKVATSFAHGVPIITSPIAAEGMGCEPGVHLLVAETIPQWVDCVVRAYTDKELWRNLSDNGQALMRETFSMEAGLARLRSSLKRLGCPVPSEYANGRISVSVRSDSPSNSDESPGFEHNGTVEARQKDFAVERGDVRAIAFYLPQYHPIAENDLWWGKGFTEWTYVTRAKALFRDHYQPQLPSELGFYDLRLDEVREAQADLAREHGIYGFCYYYYWFGGRHLLERPLSAMLGSARPDFPFCLCWANENWTRRWDGREQEILLKQEYSTEADRAFIQALFPALADRRYIRVNGKPLLLVYRTESLPNPEKTVELWRSESVHAGIGDLYLCRVESFLDTEPESIGFDAACQFPPLLIYSPELSPASFLHGIDLSSFQGKMFDYRGLAREALNIIRNRIVYRHFFGVCPSWDNTPRRGKEGYMWLYSSPEEYEKWIVQAVKNTLRLYHGDERLIFINAWNEWGEGCHLEPDQKYGRSYLRATQRALAIR